MRLRRLLRSKGLFCLRGGCGAAWCLLCVFAISATQAETQEESAGRAMVEAGAADKAVPVETKADMLLARRQYMEAIRLYETLAAPGAATFNKLGVAYEKMRLYPQAKMNFERALAVDPKFSVPENNLGTVFYVQGDLKRAEQHYKRALKRDPRNASTYSNLGTLYFTKKKIHKGVEAYQQAVSLDPEIFQRSAQNGIQTEGSPESRMLINYYLAQTCAQAGLGGSAILYLERAVVAGFHDGTKLQADRHFDALRHSPEFEAVLESMAETHAATAVKVAQR